jgi:hypothetical protein
MLILPFQFSVDTPLSSGGFSEPRSGIEKPRSSIDVVRADDLRSVKSTEDEGRG